MVGTNVAPSRRFAAHEPPRILLLVSGDERRAPLAQALRDTGYEVIDKPGDLDGGYDLAIADADLTAPGGVPLVLLAEEFEVADVEMTVLTLLGWDGPATLRRLPPTSARH